MKRLMVGSNRFANSKSGWLKVSGVLVRARVEDEGALCCEWTEKCVGRLLRDDEHDEVAAGREMEF